MAITQCFIVVLLSVFLLINTIGAPPVVEKPAKDKGTNESKTDNSDDEVVRRTLPRDDRWHRFALVE